MPVVARIYYGDPFSTADMTGTTKSIRMRPNDNVILKAMRTWLIFNDYTSNITALTCKIYSDSSSAPGALIATSTNSFSKSEIIATNTGFKEIYFLFNNLSLHSGTFYHFVLNCSGYTYADANHIAWRKAWPDPVYRTGLDNDYESLGTAPYCLTLIGAPL